MSEAPEENKQEEPKTFTSPVVESPKPPAEEPKAPAPEKPAPKPKVGKASSKQYKATTGLEYPTSSGTTIVEAGEVATEIPSNTVKAWLAQGIIEEIN
jgi:hypothetical protein